MEPEFNEEKELKGQDKKHHGPHHPDDDCDCGHGHPHHGPRPGPKSELPPHILREIMEMKEKIGKLEGIVEVLLKKLD